MNTQRNFSAYMPLTLSKSVNEQGKEILKMSGVMSSTSRDTDGQILDPSGFNMVPIMEDGYMNWHHQSNKNPMAIIGKPTSYRLDEATNKMHLNFELFSDNPLAREVYQLQTILEGQGLSLGLSLEGQATKFKDERTKDYVEKADITGCAVTPAPKNREAIVKLMKGITDEFQLIKGDIISDGTGSEIGEDRHPLAKESLDGVKKDEDEDEDENKEEQESLTKSQVIDIVGKKFPGSTYNTLEKFYTFTLELEKSNKIDIMKSDEQKGVSPNALNKALEELGLLKGGEAKEVKSQAEVAVTETDKRLDTLEKGMVEIINLLKKGKDTEEEEEEEKKDLKKGDDADADDEAGKKEEEDEDEDDKEEGKLKKAQETNTLLKGMLEGIESSLGAKMDQFNQSLEKANVNFESALGINEALTSRLGKAEEIIKDLQEQPLGRRTVTTTKFLKKGNGEEETSLNILSKSADKRFICDTLEKSCMSDGKITDQRLANAVMQFEQSNVVTDPLVKGLLQSGYTLGN